MPKVVFFEVGKSGPNPVISFYFIGNPGFLTLHFWTTPKTVKNGKTVKNSEKGVIFTTLLVSH